MAVCLTLAIRLYMFKKILTNNIKYTINKIKKFILIVKVNIKTIAGRMKAQNQLFADSLKQYKCPS